jgi:succinoglycan biosynthesis protein ExoA
MNEMPFVTIIMPIRNEAAFIARCLGAVLAQDYPAERLEVIVADGLSTDGTQDIVQSFQNRFHNLRLIDNTGISAPFGLNTALRQSMGEIVIRVDGHCEIAPDYVTRCVQHLQQRSVDCVGGPIETVGETSGARAIALAMSSTFGVGGAAFRTVKDRKFEVETVAFPAYTRRAIEKAGLFDEELIRNQDDEYNYRLRGLGGRILLCPDIHSRYYSRSSLRSLWSQYFQYGYWKVRVMQKHPGQMRLRQFVPPLFVAILLVSLPLALLPVAGRWVFASITGSYIVANLVAATLLGARKGNWRLLPLLPLTFIVLHLAYGSGFLFGIIRFWRRWTDRNTQLNYAAGHARGAKTS